MRVAHGSTVFFMLVSFPAVTAPGENVREALMPMALTICSTVKPSMRPAAMGAANAVSVA